MKSVSITTADSMVQKDLPKQQQCEDFDEVRILLVGDPNVGKTSLIYSLVNDEFEPNLPARTANVTIPAGVSTENVTLQIVDYSDRDQNHCDLHEAIQNANVLCVVYDSAELTTLDRVSTYWIPTIRKCQSNTKCYKPIILVANKVDLVEEERSFDTVTSIIQEFVEVEAFIDVSALTQKNVMELFFAAQKAIIYPLAPLFDPHLRVLTTKCRNALINIFKLSDYDGDGLLNDHELNLFQENCFGTPLQRDALDDLKSIIKQSTMDGIINNSMTQMGFLFLHTLSIDKGRHDFTWQVLRKFNYDNNINSKSEIIGLTDKLVDDLSLSSSFSSSQSEDTEYSVSNSERDSSETFEYPDISWLRENPYIVKAGLGLTLATLCMLALKYLVRGSARRLA